MCQTSILTFKNQHLFYSIYNLQSFVQCVLARTCLRNLQLHFSSGAIATQLNNSLRASEKLEAWYMSVFQKKPNAPEEKVAAHNAAQPAQLVSTKQTLSHSFLSTKPLTCSFTKRMT